VPPAEPLSPELVLVATPEEAQRAREQLVDAPAAQEAAVERPPERWDHAQEWDQLLARMRAEAPAGVAEELPLRRERPKRRRLGWPAVAVAAVLVVAVLVGVAWARRDSSQPRLVGPTSASPPSATAPAARKPVKPPPVSVKPKPRAHKPVPATPRPKPAVPPVRAAPKKPATRAAHTFVPARVWSWAPVPGTSRYRVRFLRNGREVLDVRTAKARLVLPTSFTFHKGRYRWTVVSIAAGKPWRPIVDSTFVVARG